MANLDLQLIQQGPHLFGRDVVLLGDFKGHGAGDFPILGGFFQLSDYFFLFHALPSPSNRFHSSLLEEYNTKKSRRKDKKGESPLRLALPLVREIERRF